MTTQSPNRTATVSRRTRETSIELRLDLDGTGDVSASTGIGFLDHMIDALGRHGRMDIDLKVTGDLEVDDHHTAEDCAIVLGTAIDEALGERRGITRFSDACAPLDEALVRAVLDLSGRPWPEVHLDFTRESLGGLATENVPHFFRSLAISGRFCLHLDLIRGENDHHKAEAAFKAFAVALRSAIRLDGTTTIPSTKGAL